MSLPMLLRGLAVTVLGVGAAAAPSVSSESTYSASYADTTDLVAFLEERLQENGSHTPLPRYQSDDGRIYTYPLFLILGARKGGTTGLRITLLNHPSLALVFDASAPEHPPFENPYAYWGGLCETHFFDKLKLIPTSNGEDSPVVKSSAEAASPSGAATTVGLLAEYAKWFNFNSAPLFPNGSSPAAMSCFTSRGSAMAQWTMDQMITLGHFMFDDSADYLAVPSTPFLIKLVIPHVRMVVLLRDPFERYMSDLNMAACDYGLDSFAGRTFHTPGRAREYIKSAANYPSIIAKCQSADATHDSLYACNRIHSKFEPLMSGLYADHLERYFSLFDRSQLLLIQSNELFSDYATVLERITAFVGLPAFDWPILLEKFNTKKNTGDAEKRLKACPDGYAQYEAFVQKMQATDDEAVLREYYRSANERLFQMLGSDFGWNDAAR